MVVIDPAYHFVIGPSGSGVSTALDIYSDFGFMQAGDVRPDRLIDTFESLRAHHEHVVFSLNLRPENQQHLAQLLASLQALKSQHSSIKILYLDAPDRTLITRYMNSGKAHVFEDESLQQGVQQEKALFLPFKAIQDYSIETSNVTPGELRGKIAKILGLPSQSDEFTLNIVSFGFKYGIPQDAELLFDMRFLKNPFYEDTLRQQTGLDQPVRDYVFGLPHAKPFFEQWKNLVAMLLPYYQQEGKSRLTLAVGCTGGKHRSVCMSVALAQAIQQQYPEYHVKLQHRESSRWHAGQAKENVTV